MGCCYLVGCVCGVNAPVPPKLASFAPPSPAALLPRMQEHNTTNQSTARGGFCQEPVTGVFRRPPSSATYWDAGIGSTAAETREETLTAVHLVHPAGGCRETLYQMPSVSRKERGITDTAPRELSGVEWMGWQHCMVGGQLGSRGPSSGRENKGKVPFRSICVLGHTRGPLAFPHASSLLLRQRSRPCAPERCRDNTRP